MAIAYGTLDKYSDENRRRIFKFILLFRDLVEMCGAEIPFSSFAKGGFDIDEIPHFIEKVNTLIPIVENKNIEMQKYWNSISTPTAGYASVYRSRSLLDPSEEFSMKYDIRPEKLNTTLYLNFLYSDTIEVLDEIIKRAPQSTSALEEMDTSREKQSKGSVKMDFDSQNGVIRCGNIKPYSFHRGLRGNKPMLQLFRKLWNERKHITNGKERKRGEPFPPEALANQIDVAPAALFSKLKGISRILKTRKFPAKIERDNGILLIVAEQ